MAEMKPPLMSPAMQEYLDFPPALELGLPAARWIVPIPQHLLPDFPRLMSDLAEIAALIAGVAA